MEDMAEILSLTNNSVCPHHFIFHPLCCHVGPYSSWQEMEVACVTSVVETVQLFCYLSCHGK